MSNQEQFEEQQWFKDMIEILTEHNEDGMPDVIEQELVELLYNMGHSRGVSYLLLHGEHVKKAIWRTVTYSLIAEDLVMEEDKNAIPF